MSIKGTDHQNILILTTKHPKYSRWGHFMSKVTEPFWKGEACSENYKGACARVTDERELEQWPWKSKVCLP